MLETYTYIDDFSLYYHGIGNTLPGKVLGPNYKIEPIKYFITLAAGKEDIRTPIRQQTYKAVSDGS